MLKFLLSAEQGFATYSQDGTPKLSLCPEQPLPKDPSAISATRYSGKAGRFYDIITGCYGASHYTKDNLGDMFYPGLVALRVYAFESVGFKYNRTRMMDYIAWHYYGQMGDDFLDRTWLAYLVLKECIKDVKLTVYSSIFEPLLPTYQSVRVFSHDKPKYWGSVITEDNELDIFDKRYNARNDKSRAGTRGERMAMEYFKKAGIKFIYNQPVEYVCQYCGQHVLRPDFLLPDLDVVVEIHGPQHIEYNNGFHTTYDDFIHQQLRDVDMRKFCHEYGYLLVEIPFTDNEDIPMLIARALRGVLHRRKMKARSK